MECNRNSQAIVLETRTTAHSALDMDSSPSGHVSKPAHPSVVGNQTTAASSTGGVRSGWFWISGLSGFCIALYCTTVYYGWKAAWKKSEELNLEQDADVSDRYDGMASRFDNEIDLMEKVMFLGRKRKRLCEKAKGDVLEVSVGTGRNGQFYDLTKFGQANTSPGRLARNKTRIKSLTFVDQSSKMLEICSEKWQKEHAELKGGVKFMVADAGQKGAISPPVGSGGFGTIIQTFGLCSMAEPVEYMKTMRELVKKPGQDGSQGGRILLLEHGRGHYWWINYVLDGLAKEHADRFGCWWNRDIGKIVTDSGLKIITLKRYHFGTTWALELEFAENKKTN